MSTCGRWRKESCTIFAADVVATVAASLRCHAARSLRSTVPSSGEVTEASGRHVMELEKSSNPPFLCLIQGINVDESMFVSPFRLVSLSLRRFFNIIMMFSLDRWRSPVVCLFALFAS